MCRAYEARSMPTSTLAIILLVLLAGCQSTPERAIRKEQQERQEQVERILERTITVPGVAVKEEVEKYVNLPTDLTKPCPITHGKNRTVGEYVRVANENTPSLEDCARRMDEIRKLQPNNRLGE